MAIKKSTPTRLRLMKKRSRRAMLAVNQDPLTGEITRLFKDPETGALLTEAEYRERMRASRRGANAFPSMRIATHGAGLRFGPAAASSPDE